MENSCFGEEIWIYAKFQVLDLHWSQTDKKVKQSKTFKKTKIQKTQSKKRQKVEKTTNLKDNKSNR